METAIKLRLRLSEVSENSTESNQRDRFCVLSCIQIEAILLVVPMFSECKQRLLKNPF